MTTVTFYGTAGMWRGFEAAGHADYAEAGTDIVCAAISTLTQAAANGLTDVIHAPVSIGTNESAGYLSVQLDDSVTPAMLRDAQILLQTLKLMLGEIQKDYPGTIRIIERERR